VFTGKTLPKMAPHELTFGEHCGKFSTEQTPLNSLIIKVFYKFNTMFMRNAG